MQPKISAIASLQAALNAKAPLASPTFTGTLTATTITASGDITGANLSGTNTGDQTSVTGNAGTATALQTSRNFSISGSGITAAAQAFNGTGNVTLAASVDSGHITLARMANLAANSIIGNNSGSAAVPSALSATSVTAMLDTFTASLKGLVPPPTTATGKFLKDDGTWASPADAAAVWGSITGTLSSQSDLQTALNAKLDATVVNQTNLTRTVPTVVGNTIEIAAIINSNFSALIDVYYTIHTNGYAQSKRYILPLSYNGTAGNWQKCLPISTTGPYTSNDSEIDVKILNGTATLRIRRTSGTSNGTATISIIVGGDPSGTTVTSSSTTDTAQTVSVTYAPTSLTMRNGYTGILNDAPSQALDVVGNTVVSGTVQSATGFITTSAATGGNKLFNTADQTTNFEVFQQSWLSNTAVMGVYSGGTGNFTRNLQLGLASYAAQPTNLTTSLLVRPYHASTAVFDFTGASNAASGSSFVRVGSASSFSASSGIQTILNLAQTIVQTGTAGYTGLLINPVETSTGSGTKSLILAQVGGIDKFSVNTAGAVVAASTIQASNFASGATVSGTNTGDQTTITGNAGTATTLQNARNFSISGSGITASAQSFDGSGNVVLAASVDSGHITLSRMADVSSGTIFYRKTAGSGSPETQTLATLKTDLGLTGTNSGDQTTITGNAGTATTLQTARNFSIGGGGITASAQSFDGSAAVTLSASVDSGHITLARMADMATASFIGRNTASTGVPEVLSIATVKTMLGLTGTNSGDQTITLTGDVTGSGTGSFAATIANASVTLGKMANLAANSFIGNNTGVAATPIALTSTQATALLNTFTTSLHGLVPAPTTSTGKFLKDNGTWDTPAGGGGSWGTITGTLSAQTDLQSALDGKLATSHEGAGGTVHANAVASGAAGFMSGADKAKLDGVASGATANTGTVTSVSVVTANGVSGSVATDATTPAITLTLGAITPTSVAATGSVTGSNLSGTNTGDQTITLTGDVTGSGTGSFAATVANSAITNAKLANVATATFKGRVTASTGAVEDLSATEATSLLNTFTATLKGLVPPPTSSTGKFLKDDGTWDTPAGGSGITTGKAIAMAMVFG